VTAPFSDSFSPSLHGLRAIAALSVVLFHWYQIFPAFSDHLATPFPDASVLSPVTYFGFGWLGVPLFFVLSGYLLGGQVIHRSLSVTFLRIFWARRLLRIYPAVWFHLGVLVLVAPLVTGLIRPEMLDSFVLQLLLWINMPTQMQPPISNVLWTLPIELSFYVVLPFIGVISRRVHWILVLSASLTVTLLWRNFLIQSQEVENYVVLLPYLDMLPGTLFTFMVGYSLNFLPELPDPASVKSGLLVSGILFLALLQWQLSLNDVYWTGHWILIIWPPCVALTIAMIVYFVEQPALSSKWLEYPVMIWLGNISFGVYLWHYPIMRSMALLTPETWSAPEASLAALPVALLATLSIATLSYRWIERPLMNWGRSPS